MRSVLLEIPTGATYEEVVEHFGGHAEALAEGFNATVARVEDVVLKLSRVSGTWEEATALSNIWQQEHDVTTLYLREGIHTPPTVITPITVEAEHHLARALVVQPYVEGPTLGEAWKKGEVEAAEVTYFLSSCLRQFRHTSVMPDIDHIHQVFRVFESPNIIVDPDTGRPVLVDTAAGKTQRRIGPIYSGIMAVGAMGALGRVHTRSLGTWLTN